MFFRNIFERGKNYSHRNFHELIMNRRSAIDQNNLRETKATVNIAKVIIR